MPLLEGTATYPHTGTCHLQPPTSRQPPPKSNITPSYPAKSLKTTEASPLQAPQQLTAPSPPHNNSNKNNTSAPQTPRNDKHQPQTSSKTQNTNALLS
mmetsp:Transcript_10651/g.16706  ORF Transcript_10651/g.16706 Transcript_10651/m.16706 type:complete len:98 (+) Transcript_10651:550-843(+)